MSLPSCNCSCPASSAPSAWPSEDSGCEWPPRNWLPAGEPSPPIGCSSLMLSWGGSIGGCVGGHLHVAAARGGGGLRARRVSGG